MAASIGHNKKVGRSVNGLSTLDRTKLKGAIKELNDSLTRIAAEREFQKEAVERLSGELGIEKKLIKKLAKTYFSATYNEEVEEHKIFEEFYQVILSVVTI
jgi:hypothetical protein